MSASVTGYGRDMIQLCETVIAKEYPGSVTVYGDTDSVMVKFAGVTGMEAAIRVGKEAADLLTTRFQAPIRLEFEKIFFPFLLISTWGFSVEMGLDGLDMLHESEKGHIAFHAVAYPTTRNAIAWVVAV